MTSADLLVGVGGQLGATPSVPNLDRLEVYNAINIDPTGTLNVTDSMSVSAGTLNNDGQVNLTGSAALLEAGALVNNASVRGGGRVVTSVFVNSASGELRAEAGQRIQVFGGGNTTNAGTLAAIGGELDFNGTLTNNGTVNIDGGELRINGAATNSAGATLGGRNGTLRFDSGLTNNGTVGVSFGNMDFFGEITNQNAGVIAVAGGASQATFFGDVVNNATISVGTGSQAVFFGDVSGSGAFSGGGDYFFEGNVAPGNSPGVMQFSGNASIGSGSTLTLEIGGTAPGSQYDQFIVDGGLVIDGDIQLELIDGFAPQVGDAFALITSDALSGGGLGTAQNLLLGGGLGLVVQLSPQGLGAIATLQGDTDLDGDVDDADLGTAFSNFTGPVGAAGGRAWQQGDADNDGDVDDADLGTSFSNFTGPLSLTSVPEPASLGVLAVGGLAVSRRRRGA